MIVLYQRLYCNVSCMGWFWHCLMLKKMNGKTYPDKSILMDEDIDIHHNFQYLQDTDFELKRAHSKTSSWCTFQAYTKKGGGEIEVIYSSEHLVIDKCTMETMHACSHYTCLWWWHKRMMVTLTSLSSLHVKQLSASVNIFQDITISQFVKSCTILWFKSVSVTKC